MIFHHDAHMMCERYLLGELSEEERAGFEYHMFNCNSCFEQVNAGARFIDSLKSDVRKPLSSRDRENVALITKNTLVLCAGMAACITIALVFPFQVAAFAPWIVVTLAVLGMTLSVLFRYNSSFRQWWQRHVCAHMEKHL